MSSKAKCKPGTKAKKTAPRKKKTKTVKKTVVEETTEEVVPETVEQVTTTPPAPRRRPSPTRETVMTGFDELVESVEAEIKTLRESGTKVKGVKFLRSLNKKLKMLRSKASRVMKQKRSKGRINSKNSGFLKPVRISSTMSKFTGWDKNELKSRVDVTKYICDYIKQHDLQNPDDRRQIKPDAKLQKLLGYNPKKEKEPLRYYSLQTYLKQHFPKANS